MVVESARKWLEKQFGVVHEQVVLNLESRDKDVAEAARRDAIWAAHTPIPSGNGDYQLGWLKGQQASQEAITALTTLTAPPSGAVESETYKVFGKCRLNSTPHELQPCCLDWNPTPADSGGKE